MWDWAIWGALVLAGTAGTAALALLFVRTREARRRLRTTRLDILHGLDDVEAKASLTAAKLTAAGDTAELQRSLGRLRGSIARLAVLRTALDDAQLIFGRFTTSLPRP